MITEYKIKSEFARAGLAVKVTAAANSYTIELHSGIETAADLPDKLAEIAGTLRDRVLWGVKAIETMQSK